MVMICLIKIVIVYEKKIKKKGKTNNISLADEKPRRQLLLPKLSSSDSLQIYSTPPSPGEFLFRLK